MVRGFLCLGNEMLGFLCSLFGLDIADEVLWPNDVAVSNYYGKGEGRDSRPKI